MQMNRDRETPLPDGLGVTYPPGAPQATGNFLPPPRLLLQMQMNRDRETPLPDGLGVTYPPGAPQATGNFLSLFHAPPQEANQSRDMVFVLRVQRGRCGCPVLPRSAIQPAQPCTGTCPRY
jgi:hypothetical protein